MLLSTFQLLRLVFTFLNIKSSSPDLLFSDNWASMSWHGASIGQGNGFAYPTGSSAADASSCNYNPLTSMSNLYMEPQHHHYAIQGHHHHRQSSPALATTACAQSDHANQLTLGAPATATYYHELNNRYLTLSLPENP